MENIKKIIFFEKKECLPNINDETLLVTESIKDGLMLRQAGKNVCFFEDLFSFEDVKRSDAECMALVELIVHSGKETIFLQYALIPHFIKIFRVILGLDLLLKKNRAANIVVIKSGLYTRIVVEYLKQKNIPFEMRGLSIIKKIKCWSRDLEDWRQTNWVNTWIRNYILEPGWLVALLILGRIKQLKRMFSLRKRDGNAKKRTVIIAGDRFNLPVYQKLKDSGGWDFILASKPFPARKLFMAENLVWLEEYADFWGFINLFDFSGNLSKFGELRQSISGRLEYRSINLWELCRKDIRTYFFTTLPLIRIIYNAALKVCLQKKPAILIMSNDVIDYNRALWLAAQKTGVPSLVVQHGFLLEPNGHSKILVDKLAGWGMASVEWYGRLGNHISKVSVTGNPRFDNIKNQGNDQKITAKDKTIMIGTDIACGFSVENSSLKNFKMISAVLDAIKELDGFKVIIKIHPGERLDFYDDVVKKYPNIKVVSGDFRELLKRCAIYVSDYSTTILEAAILRKPTILFRSDFQRRLIDFNQFGIIKEANSAAGVQRAITEIVDAQWPENFKNDRVKFIEWHAGKVDGRSSDRICELIDNLAKRI